MKPSKNNSEKAQSDLTRRVILCGVGTAITGLFAGCTDLSIFGSSVKVVDWYQADDLAGETTFVVVLKNQRSKTSVTVRIELRPKSTEKSKTVTLASGEKHTVRITMMVPDGTKNWVVYTETA